MTDTTLNDLTQWTGTSWTPWTAESPWEQTDPRFHIDPGGGFWDRTGSYVDDETTRQTNRQPQTDTQTETDRQAGRRRDIGLCVLHYVINVTSYGRVSSSVT